MIGYEFTNRQVMRLFTDGRDVKLTPTMVAKQTGLTVYEAGKVLYHLKKLGLLVRINYGGRKWRYELPTGPGL